MSRWVVITTLSLFGTENSNRCLSSIDFYVSKFFSLEVAGVYEYTPGVWI